MFPEGFTPVLEFEKPIVELELRVEKLRALAAESPDIAPQLDALERQVDRLRHETFSHLTRWQKVQLARHPARPSPLDYLDRLASEFTELHGDRTFGDDPAMIGGPARVAGRSVMVIAHARGRTKAEQERRNFGMSRPEGFRKAARLARLADRLGLPVVTFVDTPGAYPGDDAEERGQAPAIAAMLMTLAEVRPPVVACVVGEGGSGGALALCVADRLLMQEYSVFPVISPEACSSILYRDGTHGPETAEALKLAATDLHELGLADRLVAEPPGGAHRDLDLAARLVGAAIGAALDELARVPEAERLEARYRRIRTFGAPALRSAE